MLTVRPLGKVMLTVIVLIVATILLVGVEGFFYVPYCYCLRNLVIVGCVKMELKVVWCVAYLCLEMGGARGGVQCFYCILIPAVGVFVEVQPKQ